MHVGHRLEYIVLVDAQLALTLQLMGEDVEQDLGIGIGVDVTQILHEHLPLEVFCVGQIAVVRQADPVG